MQETFYINKNICRYRTRFGEPCGRTGNNGWCSEHEGTRCVLCGKKAMRGCDFTDINLDHPPHESDCYICTASLCDSCEHEPYVPGVIMFPRHQIHVTGEEATNLRSNPVFPPDEWHDTDWKPTDWMKIDSE
jgi:hypothetical protein